MYFQPGWRDRGVCVREADGQRQRERTAGGAVKGRLETVFLTETSARLQAHAGDRPSSCAAVPWLLR